MCKYDEFQDRELIESIILDFEKMLELKIDEQFKKPIMDKLFELRETLTELV